MQTMSHAGTKYEHAKQNAGVDRRTPFNYCSLCNGWFPRHDPLNAALERFVAEQDVAALPPMGEEGAQ